MVTTIKCWVSRTWILFLFMATLAHAEVKVDDAWVRLLPPTVTTTAAYMRFISSVDDTLIAITSAQVERIEIHQSSMTNGVMNMSELPELALPANSEVVLSPQGTHLMLIGLKAPLQPGDKLAMTLQFAHQPALEVEAPIERR